jgi:DNA-binding NtrC family response regulator
VTKQTLLPDLKIVMDGAGRLRSSGEPLSSSLLETEERRQARLRALVGKAVEAVERHFIGAALEAAKGNRTAAARLLGLSRQSLYVKLARYGFTVAEE